MPTMTEPLFLLHPGLLGHIQMHWEMLNSEDDPLAVRARKGEVPVAEIVIAFPPLPFGWMPGRFFALVRQIAEDRADWKEVTAQVKIDLEKGLAVVPEVCRERYREIAAKAAKEALPKNVGKILKAWLKEHGFDGLFSEYGDCACELEDLVPCGECFSQCEPGYKTPCDCGEHDWHISSERK